MRIKNIEFKQVILVRQDLKMPKGKMAAQVAHASVDAVLKSKKKIVKNWKNQGMKKICLKVENLDELFKCINKGEEIGLTTSVITDAGKTVFKEPTTTCAAIGPEINEKIDLITKDLKML